MQSLMLAIIGCLLAICSAVAMDRWTAASLVISAILIAGAAFCGLESLYYAPHGRKLVPIASLLFITILLGTEVMAYIAWYSSHP